MLQDIGGRRCYVVEFATLPELPITGFTKEESLYEFLIHGNFLNPLLPRRSNGAYAEALTKAIESGLVSEPGKYAIWVDGKHWEIARVLENIPSTPIQRPTCEVDDGEVVFSRNSDGSGKVAVDDGAFGIIEHQLSKKDMETLRKFLS